MVGASLVVAIGRWPRRWVSLILASTLALPAHGTPPSPAARLTLEVGSTGEAVLPGDAVPIRIAKRESQVTQLVVTATLQHLDPSTPDARRPPPMPIFERTLENASAQTVEIPVSLDRGEQALLDVRLVGKLARGGGFSDRLLRTLRRDADGRLIVSPVTSAAGQRSVPR